MCPSLQGRPYPWPPFLARPVLPSLPWPPSLWAGDLGQAQRVHSSFMPISACLTHPVELTSGKPLAKNLLCSSAVLGDYSLGSYSALLYLPHPYSARQGLGVSRTWYDTQQKEFSVNGKQMATRLDTPTQIRDSLLRLLECLIRLCSCSSCTPGLASPVCSPRPSMLLHSLRATPVRTLPPAPENCGLPLSRQRAGGVSEGQR